MVVDKPKKSNRIIGALTIIVVTATIGIVVTIASPTSFPAATVTTTTIVQSAEAWSDPTISGSEPKAPMVTSQDGNNIYVVW